MSRYVNLCHVNEKGTKAKEGKGSGGRLKTLKIPTSLKALTAKNREEHLALNIINSLKPQMPSLP